MQKKVLTPQRKIPLGILSILFFNLIQGDLSAEMSAHDANLEKNSLIQTEQQNGNSACCTLPKVEIHGIFRGDVATMDRTPQLGAVIQPYTIQIPLDKQKENRHAVTYFDARASSVEFDISHTICDTKVFGVLEIDFDNDLDFGFADNLRNSNFLSASLDQAFLHADFPNQWSLTLGYTWDLISTTNVAWPLDLPICDLYAPAGLTYSKAPLIKLKRYSEIEGIPGEFHYFVGAEQQWLWAGVYRNNEIALRPVRGEPLEYPLVAAGASWERWEPLQVDVRFALGQNRYAVKGSRKCPEKLGWLGKVSVQSQIWGPTIYGAYTYMDGMDRFALLAFPDAILTTDDQIKNVRGHGVFGGVCFDICGLAYCNAMAGYAWAKPIHGTSFDGDIYNRYLTGQIAFWRDFGCNYTVAVEYKRWQVKAIDGDAGHMNVFMGTFFFRF